MYVGALRIDIHIPDSHSLKERRAAVKPIIEGLRRRYAVAAADVGHQDTWQRATIGVACVAGEPGHVEEVLEAAERFVWSFPEIAVLQVVRQWLDRGDFELA